ncbi:hypothetical protein SO694_00029214 [Aureococcus anophagefferens]|uniref:Uncharacterized protein n=1 Tax=Aureococcus anophagefferens TaxID=44056 RepID=A0ABR1FVS2_AURAN
MTVDGSPDGTERRARLNEISRLDWWDVLDYDRPDDEVEAIMDEMNGLRRCLDQGADVDAVDERGYTLLRYASQYGDSQVVKLALDRGAAVDGRGSDALHVRTPLYAAAHFGHFESALLLLVAGADVERGVGFREIGDSVDPDHSDSTPLMTASTEGRVDVVELLLEYGADVNKAGSEGMTPLGCACIRGRVGVVKVLLDGGADWRKKIFTTGKNLGVNPLFSACVNQHVDVARVLLARGLFDYDKDDVNTTFYVIQDAECSPGLKALFDSYFVHYWRLRARLRCIGRPSEPQRRVVGDPYLANHLGSFLFGDGIILEREDAPDAPSARRASLSTALASSMAEVRAALGDGAGNPSLLAQLKQSLSDAARVVELEAAREAALGAEVVEDRAERLGPELAELTGLLQQALSLQASIDPGS